MYVAQQRLYENKFIFVLSSAFHRSENLLNNLRNWNGRIYVLICFLLLGCVFYYGIFQMAVWWFCHVVSLFWKIRFPLHARLFENAHHMKYIHIAMVTVGLVLPTLPVIVTFTAGDPSIRGFGLTSFPPTNCDSLQMDPIFYSLVLPINLILVTGIPMLIIMFWIIHKVNQCITTQAMHVTLNGT